MSLLSSFSGGYLYSVFPKNEALTEECLQRNPLSFVGVNHTIRYLDGRAELQISAIDVNEGTYPKGSTWRRNPVPACNCDGGGAAYTGTGCKTSTIDDKDGIMSPDLAYWNGSQPMPKVCNYCCFLTFCF